MYIYYKPMVLPVRKFIYFYYTHIIGIDSRYVCYKSNCTASYDYLVLQIHGIAAVDAARMENHQTHLFIANCKPESRILGKPKDEVLYAVIGTRKYSCSQGPEYQAESNGE